MSDEPRTGAERYFAERSTAPGYAEAYELAEAKLEIARLHRDFELIRKHLYTYEHGSQGDDAGWTLRTRIRNVVG